MHKLTRIVEFAIIKLMNLSIQVHDLQSTTMGVSDCPQACSRVAGEQADTLTPPSVEKEQSVSLERMYQVILFNDDFNTCEYVVACLISIFKHPRELAVKIMREAHERGRAIAEVESRDLAFQHTVALLSAGLGAKAEEI